MNVAAPYRSPVRRREALLLGGAALALGACSRSGQGTGRRSTGGDPVTIMTTAGSFAVTMQQLMRDQRFLEKQGLRPNFVSVADGTKVMGALINGDADLCTASGFGQVLPAIERGGPLKVLAGSEVLLLHLLYSSRPDIRSVGDLAGRTVGIGPIGALLHSITVALLRKRNVDPDKVRFVNVGSSADVFRAVAAGVVDAGPSELDYEQLQSRYHVHGLADGRFWDALPEYTNQAAYAAEPAIRARREVLVRTLAAYANLYRYIAGGDSREAYVAARAAAVNKDEREEALAQWNFFQQHPAFAVDLLLSEERVRYMQELNVSLGVQKSVLPYAQVADMSLAREALKLIGGS